MSEDFEKRLDFDSDTFEEMKRDMNFVLQRLIGNMQEKGTNEGSMTLKIDVTMVKEFIPNYDPDIKGESREISKPQFKHKVTSAVKINDEKSGSFNNEMELVMDEDTGIFKLVPIANTAQRSIFDSDFQQNKGKESEGEEPAGSDAVEGKGVPLLPGPDNSEEVIDGQYREVEAEEPESNPEPEPGEGLEDITDELMGGEEPENGEDDGYGYEEPEDGSEE
uniref:hypothetical protein n=1 Tax=Enterocloster clostridioformis TaxID=1531 RepID=UPI002676DE62|nr:hypothetical protein [Enterocloster clostridioformis]